MKLYIYASYERFENSEDQQPHLTPVLSATGIRSVEIYNLVLNKYKGINNMDQRIIDFLLYIRFLLPKVNKKALESCIVLDFPLNFVKKVFVKQLVILNVIGLFKFFLYGAANKITNVYGQTC